LLIGVPKETKNHEYRVGLTPAGAEELTAAGHQVWVQKGAGLGSGIPDAEYVQAGAQMVGTPAEVYRRAELVVKVKEPLEAEYPLIRRGQTLFCYFHFAPAKELTRAMMKTGATCAAFETLRLPNGEHPLLTPMSEVAGKMAIQEGAKYLERSMGGKGILLGGVPGVRPARVAILGGGVVGTNAAKAAAGLGARVTVLDKNAARLRYLDDILPENVDTVSANRRSVREACQEADLLVGAVYSEGAKASRLVTEETVKSMRPGSVIVDVSIDQGGCVATSRPTSHSDPVFTKHGVVHYCVTNIPGAVGMTSTFALANATLPYVLAIAEAGIHAAAKKDPAVRHALNIVQGRIVHPAVAAAFKGKDVPALKHRG